ncbi:MAG: hypothetical protein J6S14_19885 [Clostridia bacterium]|nr:hypothetical protein [Clostridia bacterium]
MDKALLNRDDIDALLAWRDEHKDLVRSAPAPLKAIEIICPVYVVRAFRNEDEIKLYLKHNGVNLGYFLLRKRADGQWIEIKSTLDISWEDKRSMFTVYGSLMALMVYGNDGVERREYIPNKYSEKSPTQKKRKTDVTYILQRKGGSICALPQGSHASPSGVFTVRGHWRHYKSGKEVWIAEYKKGCGKKTRKTYKPGFGKGELHEP